MQRRSRGRTDGNTPRPKPNAPSAAAAGDNPPRNSTKRRPRRVAPDPGAAKKPRRRTLLGDLLELTLAGPTGPAAASMGLRPQRQAAQRTANASRARPGAELIACGTRFGSGPIRILNAKAPSSAKFIMISVPATEPQALSAPSKADAGGFRERHRDKSPHRLPQAMMRRGLATLAVNS